MARKRVRRAKNVQGFGVTGQKRTAFRGEAKTGTYEGFPWILYSEKTELFQWRIAGLSGFAGPQLCDALLAMKRAVKAVAALRQVYGEIPEEKIAVLARVFLWERRARHGRIKVTGPHGAGDKRHYRVYEVAPQ